jgi:hypothetical protein
MCVSLLGGGLFTFPRTPIESDQCKLSSQLSQRTIFPKSQIASLSAMRAIVSLISIKETHSVGVRRRRGVNGLEKPVNKRKIQQFFYQWPAPAAHAAAPADAGQLLLRER